MILAILSTPSITETLLNNLSEADFKLEDVSVVMGDTKVQNKIAHDTGPLKGVRPDQMGQKLAQLGVSAANAELCSQALKAGKVVVMMEVEQAYAQAAEEMFSDARAQLIKE
jgi:hypothetical protein